MEIYTILLILFTLTWFGFAIWTLIEWVEFKKEENQTIRHFIGKKEIGKKHKFSEREKCEICLHIFKKYDKQ